MLTASSNHIIGATHSFGEIEESDMVILARGHELVALHSIGESRGVAIMAM